MCTMITVSKQPTWILRRLTSSLGAIILHGPHQSAKKSTTTNLSVCSLLLKSSCNIKWDWVIYSITLQCRGVFRYPYHPTCRMLNFWLHTVWCWKIQEFVYFTLTLHVFHQNVQILSSSKGTMTCNPKFYGTHLQHKYAPVKVLHSDGVRRGVTHSYFNLMHGNRINVGLYGLELS